MTTPGSPPPREPSSAPVPASPVGGGSEHVFGRLLPGPPITVTAGEAYADPGRTPHGDRPWLLVNMIASVDGATAVEGRSGGLGAAGDRAVFRTLRGLADVVLVGAGTARAERYGPPTTPGQQIAVVTASGRVDGLDRLLESGAAVVVTTTTASVAAEVDTIRAGVDQVDLPGALAQLRQRGASVALSEGGPSLNGTLFGADLVDELCLTVAPLAVGGDSARISHGTGDAVRPLRLASVLADDEGYLFTRWLVAR